MEDYEIDGTVATVTGVVSAMGAVFAGLAKSDFDRVKSYNDSMVEMARIEAGIRQEENAHREQLAKIAALERLKSQENEMRRKLIETAEKCYNRKMDYYQMLAKNAQEYFEPLRNKLLSLIDQTQFSCMAKSSTGKEYDAYVVRLESLKESLDKCNKDYKDVVFNLSLAASNAKLELKSENPQRLMIENDWQQ